MSELRIDNPLTCRPMNVRRILGQYTQGRGGPLLVVLTGIHGNEPSGLQGFDAVLKRLQADEPPMFGTLVGIACNLPAIAAGKRFIDEDLNRIWLPDRVADLRNGGAPQSSEQRELIAVLEKIEDHRRSNRENFFIDCHSTSSESVPYISVPVDAASVELAGEFPVHTVVGGGDKLTGVSDRYLIDHGFRGFTFEGGQHQRLATVEAQEAAIWVALKRVGCLTEAPHHAERCLARTQLDGHQFFEFEYVHRITPDSGFRMRPGYVNFQRIHEGDLLAYEDERPIISSWDARVFLPLYQAQGDDGFSVIREVQPPMAPAEENGAQKHSRSEEHAGR